MSERKYKIKMINKTLWTIIVSFCIFTVLASLPFSKANNEDNNKSSSTAPAKHTDLSEEENEDIKKFWQEYPQLRQPQFSYGNASDGLAAFLICERKQFKLNEPVGVLLGIVSVRLRKHITVQPPFGPCKSEDFSWFSIIGPDDKDIPYTGFPGGYPLPVRERAIRLWKGQFFGMQYNLQWGYKLDKPGIYTIEWNYRFPRTFNASWWQGHLVSNEIKVEIVP